MLRLKIITKDTEIQQVINFRKASFKYNKRGFFNNKKDCILVKIK